MNCATGNEVETQNDIAVGGYGPELDLTRTYNSELATEEKSISDATPDIVRGSSLSEWPFGYGWTASYGAFLEFGENCVKEPCTPTVATHQENGSVVFFEYRGEEWRPVSPLTQATLTQSGGSYVYTLPSQTKLIFNAEGLLTSEADSDGNALTMHRDGDGRLESVSDGAGRELTFSYDAEGQVSAVTEPTGGTVKYTYEDGDLTSVTEAGESQPAWRFDYGASNRMTAVTNGRGETTTTKYEENGRVASEVAPTGATRRWEYLITASGSETTIHEPDGAETQETFNEAGLSTRVTRAAGTSQASTTLSEYNKNDELVATTAPNDQTTTYTYDAAGDRTSETSPLGATTEWTYDSKHDITSIKQPSGETTTIERNEAGQPVAVSRAAPDGATQTTTYKYGGDGEWKA